MKGRLLCWLMAVAAAGGAGVVQEMSYTTSTCTGKGTVAKTWVEAACEGVGNQPPYVVSEVVKVDDIQAVFSYYASGNCSGAPYQVSNQTLNRCTYFSGNLYTMFIHSVQNTTKLRRRY